MSRRGWNALAVVVFVVALAGGIPFGRWLGSLVEDACAPRIDAR